MKLGVFIVPALMAVSMAQGATITAENVSYGWFTNNTSGGNSASNSPDITFSIEADGWLGSGTVSVSAASGTASSPFVLSLSNLSVTCSQDGGCGYLEVDFAADWTLDAPSPSLSGPGVPWQVDLTGSGPNIEFTGQNRYFFESDSQDAGTYAFQGSGTTFANASTAVHLAGEFDLSSENNGDTVSLPDSFDIQFGRADASPAPEPASLSIGAGALLLVFAGWRWRQRKARA